jgi:hypothetical protein
MYATCRSVYDKPKIKKMEMQKFSFTGIKNMLSRDEMKSIRGGSGDDGCSGKATCYDGTVVGGYFYCDTYDGSDGDVACGSHGPSVSCDCD